MWLYMISFYIEASPETRKRRLPYIAASLIILILTSASSIMLAVKQYKILFEIAPGPENLQAGAAIILQYQDRFGGITSLLGDCAFRVGDFVLVCLLIASKPQDEL